MTPDENSETVLTANGFTDAEEQEILRQFALLVEQTETISIEEFLEKIQEIIDEN